MIFVIVLILVFCALLAYWCHDQAIKTREFHEKIKNFPGTNLSYPLIGDLHLAFTKWSIREKIKYFIKENRLNLTTFKVWFGTKLVIMINNPEDLKTILTSPYCTDRSSVYQLTIGGEGLFVTNGEKWKTQRRNLNTTFSPRMLHSYSTEFNRFGRNLVIALQKPATDGDKIDITPILGAHVTDLITRTLYGSVEHKFELSQYCYDLVERLMHIWGSRLYEMHAFMVLKLIQILFRIDSDEKKLNRELRCGLQPLLNQKMDQYKKNVDENNNDPINVKDEHFLEKLTRLYVEGIIGATEYRHTSMTMFLAGTETTARSISLIIFMLALHEEYQEEAYIEVCEFLETYGRGGDDIDISKLSELNFLNRFIKETLRLYPVIPFLGRKPSRDIQLKEGIIPAGTDITVSLLNIHQHPLSWGENAHKFNPDNFLPENVENRERCAFVPFSYGSRNCIGYKFAEISFCLGVIYLLKNYKFKTSLRLEDLDVGYGLTAYFMNDTTMSIELRTNTYCAEK